ncbi:MAG: hypothetical protein COB59_12365 [Rhodospirillaceae bacterium]|nr:MAG: hypothetical protein COB59_12365 [Rhodospirillaceae bacterium]
MDAKVIAVNHVLGAMAVELEDKTYLVLEASARFILEIGDTIAADWQSGDVITVKNVTKDNEFGAIVQKIAESRGEAISSVSII